MTKREAAKQLKDMGLKLESCDGGEVRVVNPRLSEKRREACAYYTEDLEDAVNTGRAMVAKGSW